MIPGIVPSDMYFDRFDESRGQTDTLAGSSRSHVELSAIVRTPSSARIRPRALRMTACPVPHGWAIEEAVDS